MPEQVSTLSSFAAAGRKIESFEALRDLVASLLLTLGSLHEQKKAVHGRLSEHCVHIHADSQGALTTLVDFSESLVTRQFYKPEAPAPGQAQEGEEQPQASNQGYKTSYEKYRIRKQVAASGDVVALGQLVLFLMKNSDLAAMQPQTGSLLSDFVKKCSFEWKSWAQVGEHPLFSH